MFIINAFFIFGKFDRYISRFQIGIIFREIELTIQIKKLTLNYGSTFHLVLSFPHQKCVYALDTFIINVLIIFGKLDWYMSLFHTAKKIETGYFWHLKYSRL